jgi:hypothetical protein
MSALHGCSHPHNLLTKADLISPPDNDLKVTVECRSRIEADGCSYVNIDTQLLVSLLDGEDHKDFL